MSTLALIHPTTLLGLELRETLERHRELWQELHLFAGSDAEVGTLSEVRGAAVMVGELEEDNLDRVDVAFFCGPIAETRPYLKRLPPAATAVVLSPDAEPDDGQPLVAGVNLEHARRAEVALSPHPGTVLLAHLLHPLRDFTPRRATATLLQPTSLHDRAGLDEVLNQTRAILSFASNPPREVFDTQLAFNLIPGPQMPIASQLAVVLGGESPEATDLATTVQVIQAGVFHSFSASLHVELGEDPGPEAVRQALAEHPANDLAVDPDLLGPIDAAGRDDVVIGQVTPDPRQPGAYWIWAVMDNLTRGGASNAVQILEAVAGSSVVH